MARMMAHSESLARKCSPIQEWPLSMAVQAGSAAGARPIRARVNNFIAKVSRRWLLAVQLEAIIRVHSG